ncbi:MAG: TRAP transporter small permease [Pseudomonadota bacterium]
MIERLGSALERVILVIMSAGFAALVVTVGLQVLARNVIKIPLIWTLDVAQLLFAWLIFVGAALAYRRGAHYRIDIVPEGRTGISRVLNLLSDVAALAVVFVLVRYGFTITQMRSRGEVPSLGISEAWFYASIPVGGILIGIFLAEKVVRHLFAPAANTERP